MKLEYSSIATQSHNILRERVVSALDALLPDTQLGLRYPGLRFAWLVSTVYVHRIFRYTSHRMFCSSFCLRKLLLRGSVLRETRVLSATETISRFQQLWRFPLQLPSFVSECAELDMYHWQNKPNLFFLPTYHNKTAFYFTVTN